MQWWIAILGALAVFAFAGPLMRFAIAAVFGRQVADQALAKQPDTIHLGPAPPDAECTMDCVRGGSKFVLVTADKIYQIANQDLAALKTHAGHKVKMTGELNGDSLTVSKIEMQ